MSGRAAVMARDPRSLVWMEEMALHSRFHFCPEDIEQRAFMLGYIEAESEDDHE